MQWRRRARRWKPPSSRSNQRTELPASRAHGVINSCKLLYRVARSATAEQWPVVGTCPTKETVMGTEPKRQEPDIPAQKPDIQPEPRPEEIPQNTDVPQKESPLRSLNG